jgi:hypothetical protein
MKLNARTLGYAVAFLLSVGVGAQIGKVATPLLFGGGSSPVEAVSITLTGSIDLAKVPETALPTGNWSRAVAIVMTERGWLSCEDIGRQLRELRREASARGVPVIFWTDHKSFDPIATQLRRERLGGISLVALDDMDLRADGVSIVTPAVVHFDSDGQLVSGVSHPERYPNVRPVSFAAEIWPPKR